MPILSRAKRLLLRIGGGASRPKLSVVVVAFNIPRELERTLTSLSPRCQRDVSGEDYEVIVVDNGSTPPVEERVVAQFGAQFRLVRMDRPSPSPVKAVNAGIASAKGDAIGIMIDGARLVTPGLVHLAIHASQLHPHSIVGALGWYLGPDYQRWAIESGYDRGQEDRLLGSIDWPTDAYRLFEIGAMDESSVDGWLAPIAELNAFFTNRRTWDILKGMDEQFDLPGGGLANHDLLFRASEIPDARLVLMLGEATFHQLHGGIATNCSAEQANKNWNIWASQYEAIRGKPYKLPSFQTSYIGSLPQAALSRLVRSALRPALIHNSPPPLGKDFDESLWGTPHPAASAITRLVQDQFRGADYAAVAAIARIASRHDPDDRESRRLLSLCCPWLPTTTHPQRAAYHVAVGDAYRSINEMKKAATHYRTAIDLDASCAEAHTRLTAIQSSK